MSFSAQDILMNFEEVSTFYAADLQKAKKIKMFPCSFVEDR